MTAPQPNLFVARGSIYYPGWQVVEQVGERQQRVLATFDDKADADEELAYVLEYEARSPSGVAS